MIPTGLRVRPKSTSATVYWKPLRRCIRNALIEGYDIILEKCRRGSATTFHVYVMGAPSRSYLLRRLSPATLYSLKIAAVNSKGAGPYSRPVVFATKEL